MKLATFSATSPGDQFTEIENTAVQLVSKLDGGCVRCFVTGSENPSDHDCPYKSKCDSCTSQDHTGYYCHLKDPELPDSPGCCFANHVKSTWDTSLTQSRGLIHACQGGGDFENPDGKDYGFGKGECWVCRRRCLN